MSKTGDAVTVQELKDQVDMQLKYAREKNPNITLDEFVELLKESYHIQCF